MDTKASILDELLSKMQKEWIPYEGPNGGEGWQSTEDPTDIRYTEEPPGQVASENTSDDELSPSEITDASEIKADNIKFDTEDVGHEIQYSFHTMDSEIQFDMGIPKDGDSAMAYHMWIDESQRGKGVATELMVAAEQEAKENGMGNLNATIGGDPEATQAFFESLGYEEGIVEDGELVQPEGEWAYYHKPLENESGDSEETSDDKESRTMSDEELDIHEYSVDGIEEAFRSASEEGSNADLVRAMELQDFRRSEISDNFWVGEVDGQSLVAEVYDYDGNLTFEKIEDFQRWMGDKFSGFRSESITDYLDQTHEESHEEEFWRGDDAYHATGPETAAKIIVSGELQSRNKTRGMGNTGVGSAVFTSMNSGAWMDVYGAVQFEIDVQAMKEDDYQPTVEPEPEIAEGRNEEMFAQQMGVYDYYAQMPHDVSEDTAIIYGDIPKKYLSLNADDQTIDDVKSHVDQLEQTGEISTEEAEEAREWVQRQYGENKSVSKSQSNWGRIYVDSETMNLGICRSDRFGRNYYKVSKSWVPYEGPQGGEGWQSTEDPDDIRYTSDPPGEIAEGYEEQAEGWGEDDDESSETDIALEEGDPRIRVDTPEEAIAALEEFDEDDYAFDYWEMSGDLAVGSIIEFQTGEFQMLGDGDTGIVVEADTKSGDYTIVTEDGVGYKLIPEQTAFTLTGEGEVGMLGVWEDPANEVATGNKEWDNFANEYIPENVKDALGIEDEPESTDEEYRYEEEEQEIPEYEPPTTTHPLADKDREHYVDSVDRMLDNARMSFEDYGNARQDSATEEERNKLRAEYEAQMVAEFYHHNTDMRVNLARVEDPDQLRQIVADIEELRDAEQLDGITEIVISNEKQLGNAFGKDGGINAFYSPFSYDIWGEVIGENPQIRLNVEKYQKEMTTSYGTPQADPRHSLWHELTHHHHMMNLHESRGLDFEEIHDSNKICDLAEPIEEMLTPEEVEEHFKTYLRYDAMEFSAEVVARHLAGHEFPEKFYEAVEAVGAVIPGRGESNE